MSISLFQVPNVGSFVDISGIVTQVEYNPSTTDIVVESNMFALKYAKTKKE
jgi:hypothetical protein